MDPLDSGDPVFAPWSRFRTRFATARLLEWLLADMEEAYPDYFIDLANRLESSWDHAQTLKAGGFYDGWMPLVTLNGDPSNTWVHEEELSQISAELFPFGTSDTPPMSKGLGLVCLLLYSALESLASELKVYDSENCDISVIRTLDEAIDLRDLDPEAFADLVDLRETRNLIVHNGGQVSLRYNRLVRRSVFEVGEDRVISAKDIGSFSRAAYWAARLTYRLAGGVGPDT